MLKILLNCCCLPYHAGEMPRSRFLSYLDPRRIFSRGYVSLEQLDADIDQALNAIDDETVQNMHVICSCFQNLQENMTFILDTSDLKFSESFTGEGKEKREYFTRVQVFERKRKNIGRLQTLIATALNEITSDGTSFPTFNPNNILIKPTSRLPVAEDSLSALRFIYAAHALVDDTVERIEAQKSEYLGQLHTSLSKILGRVDTAINCRSNRKKESALRRQVYVKRDLLEQRQDVLETLRSIQIHPHLDSQLVVVASMPLSSPEATATSLATPFTNPTGQSPVASTSTPLVPQPQEVKATQSISNPARSKSSTCAKNKSVVKIHFTGAAPPPKTNEEREKVKPSPVLPQLSNEPGSTGTLYADTALGSAFVSDTWKIR